MGRTNWILLGFGLAGCLALTVLMQRALHIKQERDEHPVVAELADVLGGRLVDRSRFRVRRDDERRVGVLELRALVGVNLRKLAADAGTVVWTRAAGERLDGLIVLCDDRFQEVERYVVPPPHRAAPMRRLPADVDPFDAGAFERGLFDPDPARPSPAPGPEAAPRPPAGGAPVVPR